MDPPLKSTRSATAGSSKSSRTQTGSISRARRSGGTSVVRSRTMSSTRYSPFPGLNRARSRRKTFAGS
ncbi:MAG: hypothetical protein L6R43_04085 [Planctomycetes bacterium]|nr:hypothetical protein [Planctomycetota bacterium]